MEEFDNYNKDWHKRHINKYQEQYNEVQLRISKGIQQHQYVQGNPYKGNNTGLGMREQMSPGNQIHYTKFTAEDLEKIIKELSDDPAVQFKNAKPVKKYPRRKLNIAIK